MKPILQYRGGKQREIPLFQEYIPKEYNRYIEPFFGGGALYFHLEPKSAIINDINSRLIDFYLDLKYDFSSFRSQMDVVQEIFDVNRLEYKKLKENNPSDKVLDKNEKLYYQFRDWFNGESGCPYLDSIVYFFINKIAYSGMIRYSKQGKFNVPYGYNRGLNSQIITKEYSDLLQGSEIYNLDFYDIFKMCDSKDFMFLDPPYDCKFNDYGNSQEGFLEKDQERLARDFKNLSCKTLMVIAKTNLTESLYQGYIRGEYHKSYAINIRNRFKNEASHIIITNF